VKVDMLVMYAVLVVGFFYLAVLRPQRRRRRAQQELLATVKQGDEIVTNEGLFGTVRRVVDTVLVLEIADGKRVRVLKSAVSQVLGAVGSPEERG
jgi:preprotein translocase subunit YajC